MRDINTITDQLLNGGALSRRGLLKKAGMAGLGLAGLGLLAPPPALADGGRSPQQELIYDLTAAVTAEALATTMYRHIITSYLFNHGLAGNRPDQAYIVAAFEQELDHYNLFLSLGVSPLTTTFYFPEGMFGNTTESYATTINTLVTLEDAFIRAYQIAIYNTMDPDVRVIAAQILGVESEHRVLARVVANDLGLGATKGLSGVPESVIAPAHAANNLAYERKFDPPLSIMDDVVAALGPFVAPGTKGFSTRPYTLDTTWPPHASPVMLNNTSP